LKATPSTSKENPFIFPVLTMFARTPTPATVSRSASSTAVGLSESTWSMILWSRWRGGSCPVLTAMLISLAVNRFLCARPNPSPGVRVSPCSLSSSWVALMTSRASHFPCHRVESIPIRVASMCTWSWPVSRCPTRMYWCISGSIPIFCISPRATSSHCWSDKVSPAGRVREQCHTGRATSGRSSRDMRNSADSSRGVVPAMFPPTIRAPGRGSFRFSGSRSRYSARPRNPLPRLIAPFTVNLLHGLRGCRPLH